MIKSKPIPKFNHERFLSKVTVHRGGCWVWAGFVNNNGYGEMSIIGNNYKAHRVSFSLFSGDLINGMVIDHICKNKSCVNPEHLRQVTQKFNCIVNGVSPTAINSRKTHCKHGHELTEANIYRKQNGRYCLICKKIEHKKYNEKLKEKRMISKATIKINQILCKEEGEK